jgi:two-component system, chemotaxis family, chemotaxis protein CheY
MEDLTPSPVSRTSEFDPVPRDAARPVVFVIDDDWDICDAVSEVLEEAGFAPLCFENGAAALSELSGDERPAAILLDLFMPVMDGWTFAERLRGMPDMRNIPIIVMTASGPHWGYPAPRVLKKPIYRHELVTAVKKAVDQEPSAASS